MRYQLTEAALEDRDQLDAWLVEQCGLDTAERVRREQIQTFRLLADFQTMGVERPDITARPVRFFAHRQNWIVYQAGEPLLIHRIYPAAQDLARLQF